MTTEIVWETEYLFQKSKIYSKNSAFGFQISEDAWPETDPELSIPVSVVWIEYDTRIPHDSISRSSTQKEVALAATTTTGTGWTIKESILERFRNISPLQIQHTKL